MFTFLKRLGATSCLSHHHSAPVSAAPSASTLDSRWLPVVWNLLPFRIHSSLPVKGPIKRLRPSLARSRAFLCQVITSNHDVILLETRNLRPSRGWAVHCYS